MTCVTSKISVTLHKWLLEYRCDSCEMYDKCDISVCACG